VTVIAAVRSSEKVLQVQGVPAAPPEARAIWMSAEATKAPLSTEFVSLRAVSDNAANRPVPPSRTIMPPTAANVSRMGRRMFLLT